VKVAVLELLSVFELSCVTVTVDEFDDDALPVVIVLPPDAVLADVAPLVDDAVPPAPPVAVVAPPTSSAAAVAPAPPPAAELVASCDVLLLWLVDTDWLFDPELADADCEIETFALAF